MIHTVAVAGYRSLRSLTVPLAPLTVITGANGSGKSSLYRSLRLLADVAQGRLIASLAGEGGLQSTLWAGPEQVSRAMKAGDHPVQGTVRRDRVSLKLGFGGDDFGYAVDLGLPVRAAGSAFNLDPEIKAEAVWAGPLLRRGATLATRSGPSVTITDDNGATRPSPLPLAPFDSMMTMAADTILCPELLVLRERMRGWRFYDQLRTDADAPARRPIIGTRAPVLDSDGANLAAAIQTVVEIGDADGLAAAVDDAFPGSRLDLVDLDGRFELLMHQSGLLRPLRSAELSDGTLRYLMLTAALLTPRPPDLMVFNEPETSLHPSLIEPLGRVMVRAAADCQIVVVSHAPALIDTLSAAEAAQVHRLSKDLGETAVAGLDPPRWSWPKR